MKSILNLGKAISKANQKQVKGGYKPYEHPWENTCVKPGFVPMDCDYCPDCFRNENWWCSHCDGY